MLAKRRYIVLLDEVQFMPFPELNRSLLVLSKLKNLGLACISPTREPYLKLGAGVRSKLQPAFVQFEPYTLEQLVRIVSECVDLALAGGTFPAELLELVASYAAGDARVAIRTVQGSAVGAEQAGSSQEEREHIEEGRADMRELKQKYFLAGLTEHHRTIHTLVKQFRRIYSTDLWE